MKKTYLILIFLLCMATNSACDKLTNKKKCFFGAYIKKSPTASDITQFAADYGKQLNFTMISCDWSNLPDKKLIKEIENAGSQVMLTWEPWISETKTPIDFNNLIRGHYDEYIHQFAKTLKSSQKTILLRFAPEMNGNWYPWSTQKIPTQQYQAVYVYIWHKFLKVDTPNVKWVFSIHWKDVPFENFYYESYPGDDYVDAIGIDGYNWGTVKEGEKWMSFKEIFAKPYKSITTLYNKPIMITEFGSTSQGGDKTRWIKDAFAQITAMKEIVGIVLYNINDETDWRFDPGSPEGRELKQILSSPYFY